MTRFRRTAGRGFAAAALLALAACGTAGDATPEAGDPQDQGGFQAYVACLQQNGVTVATFGPRASRSPGAFPSRGARPSGEPGFPDGSGPDDGFPDGGGGGFPDRGGGPGGGFGGMFGSDPDSPPAGVDQATWAKALTACQSVRPTAVPRGGGQNDSAMTAYRNCLAEQGVTTSSGPMNTADPKVAAAREVCAPLLPTGRPSPTP